MSEPDRDGERRLSGRTLLVLALAVVLVVGLAVVALVTRNGKASKETGRAGLFGAVTIRSFDGTALDADVVEPPGAGRHPLVVMGSSYNADKTEYAAVARSLSAAGFVTVSYTQRGFGKSGGSIDLAGTATQRDVSSVIDWAEKNTATDRNRVGMLGVSYGAGMALLAAARDPRVRAVVALSTWTDVAEAFRPNDTLSGPALGGLLDNARASSQLNTLSNQLRSDPLGNGGTFVRFAKPRSPVTYLTALNRNKPAIMMANGWQDSLFAPTELVDFFGKLRTPKRLQLSTGDHVGPERALLAGEASRTGDASLAWLKHYLGGQQNGIDRQPAVQLEDVTTKSVQTYPSWPRPQPFVTNLDSPSTSSVALTTSGPSTWSATLVAGQGSEADAGQSQFVPGDAYKPQTISVRSQPSDRALVWAAGPVTTPTRVVGTPRLSLSVSSSAPNATIFAYLYDTGPDGQGKLMTLTPLTVTGTSSVPKRVTTTLEPTDWTLAAGHQLTVLVDTQEFRYYQAAPAGSPITVSSDPGQPAELRVPLS